MDPKGSGLDFSALATVTAAHNLQNLLAIMARCVDAIASRSPGPVRAHPDFRELDTALDGAFQLSHDLIAAVGLQRTPEPVVLDLKALLMRYQGMLQRLLRDDIRLEVKTGEEPLLVEARPVQLEWMLLNLAANGRDAMPDGGGLYIEAAGIDVPEGPGENALPMPWVHLTVWDEGTGISHRARAQLFEPFFTTRALGSGLGLTSVAVTVRELSGWLYVESDKWSGTIVHVMLPRFGTRSAPPPNS
jgi:signal transduction histidine kinase